RVARSNIWALLKLQANVKVVTLPTLEPKGLRDIGVKVYYNLEDAIRDTDIIMCLRIQLERQSNALFPSKGEYAKLLGITPNKIKELKDVIIMHPGPVNRGVEISSSLIYSGQSVICEQVTNGVAVRMAILEAVMQN
ncbi:MAG: aspartate carbamoyltransferase, partial [Synergistetes bacterium]|nr:aspartate carbamoyltransferase [Synergistota bacterium]